MGSFLFRLDGKGVQATLHAVKTTLRLEDLQEITLLRPNSKKRTLVKNVVGV